MFIPAEVLSTDNSAYLISKSKTGSPILYMHTKLIHAALDDLPFHVDYSEFLEEERDALAEYYAYCVQRDKR
jgi:hypothetical protein